MGDWYSFPDIPESKLDARLEMEKKAFSHYPGALQRARLANHRPLLLADWEECLLLSVFIQIYELVR